MSRDRAYEEVGVGLQNDGEVTVRRVSRGLADEATGGGAVFFTPRAYKRLSRDGQQVLAGLQNLAAQMHSLGEHLEEHVQEAREEGASWDLIGWSVGTTGEAARQRWGTR